MLELNEFDVDGKIDGIINRITDTGYISSSMSKDLDRVTGVANVTDKLYKKVNQINEFYKNSNSDFFDDVMLEFFEGTPYNYTVKTGIYLDASKDIRWIDYKTDFRYRKVKKNSLIPDEYEQSSNKESLLLTFLLNFLKSITLLTNREIDEYEKERKLKPIDRWDRYPRDRKINYSNYFKYFLIYNHTYIYI